MFDINVEEGLFLHSAELFHDLGKIGMSGKPYYLPEMKDGKPTGIYLINTELISMGQSLRSIYNE